MRVWACGVTNTRFSTHVLRFFCVDAENGMIHLLPSAFAPAGLMLTDSEPPGTPDEQGSLRFCSLVVYE